MICQRKSRSSGAHKLPRLCAKQARERTSFRMFASRAHPFHRFFMEMQKATFGAGCFWGVEETFRKLKGVTDTAVGYAGGTKENPTYEDVCTDQTGHAEVVQVEFDPAKISYPELLDVFWANHNPTTLNRQGPDVGTQYRSVIFYHSPEQKAAA